MGAELELVDVMTRAPAECTLCGCAPVDETQENKPPLPAIHAIGLDVNWGDEVYICWTCAGLIADLIERPDADKVKVVIERVKFERHRADKAEKKLEKIQGQLSRITDGRKALKEAKENA